MCVIILSSLICTYLLFDHVTADQCDFGLILTNAKWNSCQCNRIDSFGSLAVTCHKKSWLTVPPFNTDPLDFVPSDHVFDFDMKSKSANVIELFIVDSNLFWLSENSFKDQPLKKLDLSRNQIEKIDINAFRGLESHLMFLSLDSNQISEMPIRAISFLRNLKYLQLRHNAVDKLEVGMLQGSQLYNLNALHLDDNLIEELPENAFANVPLQVLTIENNRIRHLHITSLPQGLRHLSLKVNHLTEIPYDAIASSTESLETLDLEANNITRLISRPDLRFGKNITINLSNNRILFLDSNCFSCFKAINHLDLSHNQLNYVHETALKSVNYLEQFDLSYNKLSDLHMSLFSDLSNSLKRLNLEENNFYAVPLALASLNVLEFLNLKSNKLFRLENTVFQSLRSSLKHLQLSYNLLSVIPFRVINNLHGLQAIDLSKNDINCLDLDVALLHDMSNQNVVDLNLAGNRIKSVSNPELFTAMPNLGTLDLSNNMINSLSSDAFNTLTKLENLFLQNNFIQVYPEEVFKRMTNLRRLMLDSNRIMVLPFGSLFNMKHLEHIGLSNNRIEPITAEPDHNRQLKSLKTINLGSNYISFLSPRIFKNLPNLQMINLQGNRLQHLNTYTFYNLSNLRSINLRNNQLTRTSQLAFFDLPRLEYVTLGSNHLERIEPGTFSDVPHLANVDLCRNKFRSFESQYLFRLKVVKRLDLSHNFLTNFELHSLKSSLEVLNLNHNNFLTIEEQTFAGYASLTHLNLAQNVITDVHYKALFTMKKLTDIDFSYNNLSLIRKLTFNQQENIEKLDLSRNFIRKLDSACFGKNNLLRLDLSNNRLSSIPHSGLETVKYSLSHLDLANNYVMFLESYFFEGLKNLSSLSLKGNAIQRIEEASFKGMQHLKSLDLSCNPITDWHPNAFKDISNTIESINLAKTGLASLPAITQRSLKYLNVSYNTLYSIDEQDMLQMNRLETLDLSFNRINSLRNRALRSLINLKRLNLSRNPLASIQAEHFSSLQKLEALDCHDMPNLIRFDIRSLKLLKNLKELVFHGFPELYDHFNITTLLNDLPPLKKLNVEVQDKILRNQFAGVDCRFLRNLQVTGGTGLKSIAPDAFQNLRGHELKLSLHNTGIKHISSRMFQTMNRVTFLELDLRRNQLEGVYLFQSEEVPILNSRGTILADIRLDHNPLICDCRISWVTRWMAHIERTTVRETAEKIISNWNKTVCFKPEILRNRPVLSIDFNSMNCFNNRSCGLTVNALQFLFIIIFDRVFT